VSAVPPESGSGVVDAYRAGGGAELDELVDARRAGDQSRLADALDGLGLGALRAASAEAARLVADDGIRYGVASDGGQARNWVLDPIPVVLGAREWADLTDGLDQRAHLLDALLRDVYGPRQLLERGVIPPEIVLGHRAFIPQADGILLRGRQLVLTSSDLARGADGQWAVVCDRTATPSGAGYAMANRRIVSRVMAGLHRTTQLARLRGFFHTMRAALQEAAPTDSHTPKGVLLSPGTNSETAYEQGFMATLLGFPIVEAEDLSMRDGRVWITAGDRMDPVDVLLRRVDSAFSDPLDLRPDSHLGVPGLVEACRRRTVTVVNPIGTGVLENAALLAFLPRVSRAVLGEDLRLPSVETLWLGDERARRRVLADLDHWVVKPISRASGLSQFGSRLSAAEREELSRRVEARPWAFAAQADVAVSTAPVVTPRGLEPRRFVLRPFAVARGDDYHFLPGGLGRVAESADAVRVSNASGALAKDVWVLAPEGASAAIDLGPREDTRLAGLRIHHTVLAPRVAENLYWVGRYSERGEGTARLLRVVDDLVEDHEHRPGTPGNAVMQALLDALGPLGLPVAEGVEPLETLRRCVLAEATPGTVRYAARRLDIAAQELRDQLSHDIWHVLARLDRTLRQEPSPDWQLQPMLHDVLESTLALAGVFVESMVRDESWGFIDAGTAMERAQHVVSLLRATLVHERPPAVDGQVSEAVLEVGESIITHRRRSASGDGPAWPVQSAISLLLMDPTNPRSVAFQVARLAADLRVLGDPTLASEVDELAGIVDDVDLHEVTTGDRHALAELLDRIHRELRSVNDGLTRRHFSRMAPQRVLLTDWTPTGAVPVPAAQGVGDGADRR
jgi:uncharacterized circularly permuted ATP-grasp superfamily protein/uncharacterized alpha-E superfamily protein